VRLKAGGGSGKAVRRGNGEPVHSGLGVGAGDGVKTAPGLTCGATALNGVGDAGTRRYAMLTMSRRVAGS
jgi:hypothetical protein